MLVAGSRNYIRVALVCFPCNAAQREVDQMVSRGPAHIEHLHKFEHINGVLRKSLRLTPTAPVVSKRLVKGAGEEKATLSRGKCKIELTDKITVLLGVVQQDPIVYESDANKFKPELMMGDDFQSLPSAAWKEVSRLTSCDQANTFNGHLEVELEHVLDVHLHGKKH